MSLVACNNMRFLLFKGVNQTHILPPPDFNARGFIPKQGETIELKTVYFYF